MQAWEIEIQENHVTFREFRKLGVYLAERTLSIYFLNSKVIEWCYCEITEYSTAVVNTKTKFFEYCC